VRFLVFAYACEPQEGSEPGAGWAWARLLARFGETWVVTRSNNRSSIETSIGRARTRDRCDVDLPR